MIKVFTVFLFGIFISAGVAQQPAEAPAAQQAPAAAQSDAAAPAGAIYTTLQPVMESVIGTLQGLKLEKWKKGSVRDEASQNVDSLLRDILNNVPPLVTAADSAPGSVAKAMPLLNHLDALYDVLLRVEEASRVVAPGEQIAQLQQSLVKLASARKTLDEQLQSQAAAEEKQIADLQAELKAQQAQPKADTKAAASSSTDTPCKSATPAKRKKKAAAPAKSAAPAGTSQKPQ